MSYSKTEYYDNPDFGALEEQMMEDKKALAEMKTQDKGFAQIIGYKQRANGTLKKTKIDVYTSGFSGNNIRDAETGDYFKHIVGSLDEDLYFKVMISTGECKSKNGSNMLFYTSPEHYMRHLHITLSQDAINKWNTKYNDRLLSKRKSQEKSRAATSFIVK